MILVDANLLLYAKIRSYPQHGAAKAWLDERLNDQARVGMPWPSLLAFLRISTHSRLFERPMAIADAWQQVDQWLGRRQVWIPQPTEGHAELLAAVLRGHGIAAGLVMDAHLAALALEHGLTLCSTDGDFARFRDLRWENPLV